MELSGKCRSDFDAWYGGDLTLFNSLSFSHKIGVYEDFFEEKNIEISINTNMITKQHEVDVAGILYECEDNSYNTARIVLVDKAQEYYNNL